MGLFPGMFYFVEELILLHLKLLFTLFLVYYVMESRMKGVSKKCARYSTPI